MSVILRRWASSQRKPVPYKVASRALQVCRSVQKRLDFFGTQHGGQLSSHLWLGDLYFEPFQFQRSGIEEFQRCHSNLERLPGKLSLVEKVQLILAYLLRAKLVWRLVEIPSKVGNGFGVGPDRLVGIIPQPKILDHSLS
jgi:hypothetical protein